MVTDLDKISSGVNVWMRPLKTPVASLEAYRLHDLVIDCTLKRRVPKRELRAANGVGDVIIDAAGGVCCVAANGTFQGISKNLAAQSAYIE